MSLFGEEDSPWANLCCQSSFSCLRKIVAELTSVPVFLCFVHGTQPQHSLMSGVQVHAQNWTGESRVTKAECANATTTQPGWPYFDVFEEHGPLIFVDDPSIYVCLVFLPEPQWGCWVFISAVCPIRRHTVSFCPLIVTLTLIAWLWCYLPGFSTVKLLSLISNLQGNTLKSDKYPISHQTFTYRYHLSLMNFTYSPRFLHFCRKISQQPSCCSFEGNVCASPCWATCKKMPLLFIRFATNAQVWFSLYSVWDSWRFLNLWLDVPHQFGEFLRVESLLCFLVFLLPGLCSRGCYFFHCGPDVICTVLCVFIHSLVFHPVTPLTRLPVYSSSLLLGLICC